MSKTIVVIRHSNALSATPTLLSITSSFVVYLCPSYSKEAVVVCIVKLCFIHNVIYPFVIEHMLHHKKSFQWTNLQHKTFMSSNASLNPGKESLSSRVRLIWHRWDFRLHDNRRFDVPVFDKKILSAFTIFSFLWRKESCEMRTEWFGVALMLQRH